MNKKVKSILGWILPFVVTIVLAQLLTRFVIVNAVIPSGSMQNTVMKGDRIIANRLAYINDGPQRGDVIIFHYPVNEDELYIKRVIGLPNETVRIEDAQIFIDESETPLEETYLPEEWIVRNDGMTFEVPEGCYFVMGDNRNNSSDGRVWDLRALEKGIVETEEEAQKYHYVKEEQIVGKAMFRYWPLTEMKFID